MSLLNVKTSFTYNIPHKKNDATEYYLFIAFVAVLSLLSYMTSRLAITQIEQVPKSKHKIWVILLSGVVEI